MAFGSIYSVSYWGSTNESNGWGIIYPLNAGGSSLSADVTNITSDTNQIKADATQY
jgi:hypothetical protein